MNMRAALPLILALVVGAGTLLYGRNYLQRQQAATVASPTVVDTRQVLIAENDLPIGRAIEARDFRVVSAPLELIPTQSIHDAHQTVDRVLSVAMTSGQMLTETMLAPIGTSQGLEATIP